MLTGGITGIANDSNFIAGKKRVRVSEYVVNRGEIDTLPQIWLKCAFPKQLHFLSKREKK